MVNVYSSPNLYEVSVIKDVLLKAGIKCMLKNEGLSSGLLLGYTDSWPQVCIMNDGDLENAQEIVRDWSTQNTDGK